MLNQLTVISNQSHLEYIVTPHIKLFPSLRLLETHPLANTAERIFSFLFLWCYNNFSQSIHLKTYQIIHTGDKPYACAQSDNIYPHLVICRILRVPISNTSPFQAHYVTGLSLYLVAWRDIRGTIPEIGIFQTPNVKKFSSSSHKKTHKKTL